MGDTRVSVPWSKFFVFFGGGPDPYPIVIDALGG